MSSDDEGLAGTEAIPAGRPIPAGRAIPAGRPIPAGRAIPAGRPIPAGRAIPAGRPIPPDRAIPAGRPIPAGRAPADYAAAIPAGRPIPAGRGDQLAGVLDPAQWGAVVSTLLYERSAVLRLGARLVAAEHRIPLLAIDLAANPPSYVPRGQKLTASQDGAAGLDPTAHKLAAVVRVSSERFGAALENPEVAALLLEDLAEALALEADRAFLHGDGKGRPTGIKERKRDGVHEVTHKGDKLEIARKMLKELRDDGQIRFRNPGWVLHPTTLDALTSDVKLPDGTPLDAGLILQPDGSDGGSLLGYPFLTSQAVKDGRSPTLFFSADWSEAWIAADRALATVDISPSAEFASDVVLVRAIMRHDFSLRRPRSFAFST